MRSVVTHLGKLRNPLTSGAISHLLSPLTNICFRGIVCHLFAINDMMVFRIPVVRKIYKKK